MRPRSGALPPGGQVPEDYRFEMAGGAGGEVRLSELFPPGKETLAIYSFMFPRYSGDMRPGPASGETARLPLAETPCPSCTSILDSLDGAARHLVRRLGVAVVAKSAPDRIAAFARERGWRHLRLLSSRNNTYNRDYHAETPDGEQMPVLNVLVRDGGRIRHFWATELLFAPGDEGERPATSTRSGHSGTSSTWRRMAAGPRPTSLGSTTSSRPKRVSRHS